MGPCKNTEIISLKKAGELLDGTSEHGIKEAWLSLAYQNAKRRKGDQKQTDQIFRVIYPYGDLIVENGKFKTPCECANRPNCTLCTELREATSSVSIPLCSIIQNSVEVFHSYKSDYRSSVPLALLKKGSLFGVFESLDYILSTGINVSQWNVSSGLRSVFLCCPYNNNKLKYQIKQETNNKINFEIAAKDSWHLIRHAASSVKELQFNTELIVVPPNTLTSLITKPAFYTALLKAGWSQSASIRESVGRFNSVEDLDISKTRSAHSFLRASACHVAEVCAARMPGFCPAMESSSEWGPFTAFQHWILNVFHKTGGTHYAPVIVIPGFVRPADTVFYSISRPTVMGPVPQTEVFRRFNQTNYKEAADALLQETMTLNLSNTSICNIEGIYIGGPKNNDTGNVDKLVLTDFLAKELINQADYELNLKTSYGRSFFAGCLKITRTKV